MRKYSSASGSQKWTTLISRGSRRTVNCCAPALDHVGDRYFQPHDRRFFTYPSTRPEPCPQGYSLCGWNKSGFNYLIISGLSEAEMEKLEDLLRAQADSSGPLNDVGLME